MLQHQTIDNSTFELIQKLQKKDYLKDFILVGGTSLALQIGHRISIDIDLFTTNSFDTNHVLENLESDFSFQLDNQVNFTLVGSINGIKVDIMAHKYKLLNEPIFTEGVRLASSIDIAAMKLNAISGNGTRIKDFIDLYYLLNEYSIKTMLEAFEKKYSSRNSQHVLKSLNYFDEVRMDDWPDMIDNQVIWEQIKTKIDLKVLQYSRTLLK